MYGRPALCVSSRRAWLIGAVVVFCATQTPAPIWGQNFSNCGTNIICAPAGAYVGIGTTTPIGPLNIFTNLSSTGFFVDAYASNPNPAFIFRASEGSGSSPSGLLSGDFMGSLGARGYGTTGFSYNSKATVIFIATQNWTDSNQGAAITFNTTPNNSTTRAEAMRVDQSGNVGIGTTAPQAKLEVNGTALFDGLATFANGQTFPGTLTGTTTGGGLQVNGSTVSLTTGCGTGQVLGWTGSIWQCTNVSGGGGGTITGVTAGTDLVGGGASGAVTLNVDTTKVPQLATANTFGGTQIIGSGDLSVSNGNVDLPQTSTSGVGAVKIGGLPFIHSCCSTSNVFVGVSAGNFANPGSDNTGIGNLSLYAINGGTSNTATGAYALESNTTASDNTADGYFALGDNSTGAENTAVGYQALASSTTDDNTAVGFYALRNDTTGTQNTALGQSAGSDNVSGSYNTFIGMNANAQDGLELAAAIGYAAYVTQSNSMILGGRFSDSVMVGIGTNAPAASLHINNERSSPNLVVGQVNGTDVFKIDNNGRGYFDGGTQTSGADFAESVAVRGKRSQYEPGDLLEIDAAGRRRLALADEPYSIRVAGIYSTKPGVLASPRSMNDPATKEEVPLAVVGIVPCKVTAANGPIQVGDLLVASSLPGYAMKGRDRYRLVGAVVGKALEPLSHGRGVIQVLVTLQ
jgi:hypothetical protein